MNTIFIEDKTFDKKNFTQTLLEKGEYENCIFSTCDFSNVDLSNIIFLKAVLPSNAMLKLHLDNNLYDVISEIGTAKFVPTNAAAYAGSEKLLSAAYGYALPRYAKPAPAKPAISDACVQKCSATKLQCNRACGSEPTSGSQYDRWQGCQTQCLSTASKCQLACQ